VIAQQDIQFHTPHDAPHDWAETYFFDIFIPEANLHGWVYIVCRAGVDAILCDVEFVDRVSANMTDAVYIDIQNHMRMPAQLDVFALSNGLSFKATSPTKYRLDYLGIDNTEIHIDIEGIMEPYDIHDPAIDPMARATAGEQIEHSGFGSSYSAHFDLTVRTTGAVRVRGREHFVDYLSTMDHSWGVRPERGMRCMSYINAHFPDGYVVQTIWDFDPVRPQQHVFKHGYALVEGRTIGGIEGSLNVRRNGILPIEIVLEMIDVKGTAHRLTGAPLAANHWLPYGCCLTAMSMLDWRASSLRGIGTAMESYTLDYVTGGLLRDLEK
jgi:hypothetical protein